MVVRFTFTWCGFITPDVIASPPHLFNRWSNLLLLSSIFKALSQITLLRGKVECLGRVFHPVFRRDSIRYCKTSTCGVPFRLLRTRSKHLSYKKWSILITLLCSSHSNSIKSHTCQIFKLFSLLTLYVGQFTFSTQLLALNYLLYSPTDAAPQFLWKLTRQEREGEGQRIMIIMSAQCWLPLSRVHL